MVIQVIVSLNENVSFMKATVTEPVGVVVKVIGYLARGKRQGDDSQREWVEKMRDENMGSKYR